MAVMDEFREEREALKQGTFKQKAAYFWDYYKWHAIGTIAGIAILISVIYGIATRKENAFYAAMLNSVDLRQDEGFAADFMEYAGIDPETYAVTFDNSLYISFDHFDDMTVASTEKLMAYLAAAQLDVILSGDGLFSHYANEETFSDLREVLTEEQLAVCEPYFYYVDRTLVEQIVEAASNLDTSFDPEIPDPTKPELMDDPVPVGIYVEHSKKLTSSYHLGEGDRIVMGLLPNSRHTQTSLAFLDYLFSE